MCKNSLAERMVACKVVIFVVENTYLKDRRVGIAILEGIGLSKKSIKTRVKAPIKLFVV